MALKRRWAAEDLGERLQQRRAELGLTQEQLAEKMPGVTLRAVQRWESGETIPQDRNLYKVADALEMDPQEFIQEPVQPASQQDQLDRIEQKVDHALSLLAQRQARPRKRA